MQRTTIVGDMVSDLRDNGKGDKMLEMTV